jgi:hypothetical protein
VFAVPILFIHVGKGGFVAGGLVNLAIKFAALADSASLRSG